MRLPTLTLVLAFLLAGCAETPDVWAISIRNAGDVPLDVEVQAEGDQTLGGFRGRLEPGQEWNHTFDALPAGLHRFSGTVRGVNDSAERDFSYSFTPHDCALPEAYHHVRVELVGGEVDVVTFTSCAL